MSQVLHSELNKISLERGPQGEWTLSPRGPLSKENVLLVEAFSMNMKAFNNLP